MSKNIVMKYKGMRFPSEILRECHIDCGSAGCSYSAYLIKREVKSPFTNQFVVGVRCGDETKEFMTFDTLSRAIAYYINTIACYV